MTREAVRSLLGRCGELGLSVIGLKVSEVLEAVIAAKDDGDCFGRHYDAVECLGCPMRLGCEVVTDARSCRA